MPDNVIYLQPRSLGEVSAPWNEEDTLLTPKQLSEHLGVSPKSLERHRMTGEGVPFVRISPKVIRYRLTDVREFIGKRVVASTVATTPTR